MRGLGNKGDVVIETGRLRLREMGESDYAALSKILQDDEVMYAYEGAFSDGETRRWLYHQTMNYMMYGFGLWAVILNTTGEMIGQCGLTMQFYKDGEVLEVGYLFQKAFWGMGYATEAAMACRDYAFGELGADEVFSIVRVSNDASRKVAKRLGMAAKDTFVKYYRGFEMSHYLYSVRRGALEELNQ